MESRTSKKRMIAENIDEIGFMINLTLINAGRMSKDLVFLQISVYFSKEKLKRKIEKNRIFSMI